MGSVKYPTTDEDEREAAIAAATQAVRNGELVVFPTDTVYGLAADAFDASAVAALLAAKGRGREMPPPVLVSAETTLDALTTDIPDWARALVDRFWPGPLTLVCTQQGSLQWDLGDTRGTVAVRMPDDELALAILERTGPLAVTSANLTGRSAASDADAAEQSLGEQVTVIVDGGPSSGAVASTIIDVTHDEPRLLRPGAIGLDEINEILEPLGFSLEDEG